MRDLRSELKNWDENTPIDWKPANGDILVGFVRDTSLLDSATDGVTCVIIEEERTGINILVQIDSPQLSALFELHNPRSKDKIGIKYIGFDDSGIRRYAMLIDRDIPPAPTATDDEDHDNSNETQEDINDSIDVTPEERDFIQLMMADDTEDEISAEPEEIVETPDAHNINLKGVIQRQQDELSRQTKTLEHLEAIILQSIPYNKSPEECNPINVCDESLPAEEPQQISEIIINEDIVPQNSSKWLPILLIILATAVGALFGFLNPTLHWWLR